MNHFLGTSIPWAATMKGFGLVSSLRAALFSSSLTSPSVWEMTAYKMFTHHLARVMPQSQESLLVTARASFCGTVPLLCQLVKIPFPSFIILWGIDSTRTSSASLSSILLPIHTVSVPLKPSLNCKLVLKTCVET